MLAVPVVYFYWRFHWYTTRMTNKSLAPFIMNIYHFISLLLSLWLIITTFSSNVLIIQVSLVLRFSVSFTKSCFGFNDYPRRVSSIKNPKKERVDCLLLFKFKVKRSPSKIKLRYLFHWKVFKSDEEWFLFHLKSSFLSQDS